MPPINRNKRFSKAAQNSPFGASLAAGIEDPSKLLNAIEFIEGPNGIGIVLRPVQRVVVKSIFGVPFDFHPAWQIAFPAGVSYQCTTPSAIRSCVQMSPKQNISTSLTTK